MKSGAIAAQKRGIPTQLQVGPKGGKFYLSGSGSKVYGPLPTGRTQKAASLAAPKGRKKEPPEHLKKGKEVMTNLGGEGWMKGRVISINRNRGLAKIKLADGGEAVAPYAATKPVKSSITKRPPSKRETPPPYVKEGNTVTVNLGKEGRLSGVVTKVGRDHALVRLSDGTTAKAPFKSMKELQENKPPRKEPKRPEGQTTPVNGSKDLKTAVSDSIKAGGFGPLISKKPVEIEERAGGMRGAAGLYYDRFGRPAKVEILKSYPFVGPAHLHQSVGNGADIVRHPKGNRLEGVVTHELGHHLHLGGLVSSKTDQQIHAHWFSLRQRGDDSWVPSRYAKTDHREWFAEAHSAYVYHRSELQKNDPRGFALVKQARTEAGMED